MVSFGQYINFNLFCTPLWLGKLCGPWMPGLEAGLMKAFLDSMANGWVAYHSFRDSNINLNWKFHHQHLWLWMVAHVNPGVGVPLLLLCGPVTYILLKSFLCSLGAQLPGFKPEAGLDFWRKNGNIKGNWSITSVATTSWEASRLVFHLPTPRGSPLEGSCRSNLNQHHVKQNYKTEP